jgi:hypothetical protein
MRPEARIQRATRYVLWEHDGENVSGFILDVDATEHDLGALSPVSGTTYRADLVELGYPAGEYDITVIAYNGSLRSDAAAVALTW